MKAPAWWPPKVGDKLRRFANPSEQPLNHVVAVFDHAGETLAVSAEWLPHKSRWSYETIDVTTAEFGLYYPDGTERPKR